MMMALVMRAGKVRMRRRIRVAERGGVCRYGHGGPQDVPGDSNAGGLKEVGDLACGIADCFAVGAARRAWLVKK